jgi:hypothetical protein
MNKRIKELYREAIIYTMDNAGNKGQSSSDAMCADKFAELIIRECTNVVLNVPCYYKDYRSQIEESVINDCGRTVLEHFGIER